MKFEYYGWDDGTSLYHFGIPGQKWGIRRWQNPDGSFNEEGKKRYGRKRISSKEYNSATTNYNKEFNNTKALRQRKSELEDAALYDNDKVYALYSLANSGWNDTKNRETTKAEDDRRWGSFEKAYNKALKSKEYTTVVKNLTESESRLKEYKGVMDSYEKQLSNRIASAAGAIGGAAALSLLLGSIRKK